MPEVNDRDLIERCRAGDDRAFQELVERYKDPVFALIARTVQDHSRADDLAQDVFLRVHKGLPYFQGEARLSTWISRIVADVCVQPSNLPLTDAEMLNTELALHERPMPRLPDPFTLRTMARIRRARWRSEQTLDLAFNVSLAVLALVVIAGGWLVMRHSGLAAVSSDTVRLVIQATVAFGRRVAPSVPLYLEAAALVASALGIWWWAERDLDA